MRVANAVVLFLSMTFATISCLHAQSTCRRVRIDTLNDQLGLVRCPASGKG
jgi:hypothetical protein